MASNEDWSRNLCRQVEKALREWGECRIQGKALLQELANVGIGTGYMAKDLDVWRDTEQPLMKALDAVLQERGRELYQSLRDCVSQLTAAINAMIAVIKDLEIGRAHDPPRLLTAVNTEYAEGLVRDVTAMMQEEGALSMRIVEEAVECADRERHLLLTSMWVMQPKVSEQKVKDLTQAIKLELAPQQTQQTR